MFELYIRHWNLEVDGKPITTPFSDLMPVLFDGNPAMLKLLRNNEERTGSAVLAWWNGEGAVRVLDRLDDCLLLERAIGRRSLAEMSRSGNDDVATAILCQTAMRLHGHRSEDPPPLVPTLWEWFAPLRRSSRAMGDVLAESARLSEKLLADPADEVLLHGDLHHDNVLDGESRGWLAIDPKGIR